MKMNREERAITLDKLLRKFEGAATLTNKQIRKEEFYKEINENWYEVENLLAQLIGDEMLEDPSLNKQIPLGWQSLKQTAKGWATMCDCENSGYLARVKDIERKERLDILVKWATCFGVFPVIASIIEIVKTVLHFLHCL